MTDSEIDVQFWCAWTMDVASAVDTIGWWRVQGWLF